MVQTLTKNYQKLLISLKFCSCTTSVKYGLNPLGSYCNVITYSLTSAVRSPCYPYVHSFIKATISSSDLSPTGKKLLGLDPQKFSNGSEVSVTALEQ